MENNKCFNLMKPYYYQQLEIVAYYLNSKKLYNAIQLLITLIKQLDEDIIIFDKMDTLDAKNLLKICYAWREYYCFMWLVEDPNIFQKNKKLPIKTILKGYQEMIGKNLFFSLDEDEDEDEYKINIRFNIVQLLFEEDISSTTLQHMRQNFCAGFDRFKQLNQIPYQALALSGLALVAAYEEDAAKTYERLHFAENLCPSLNKFIHMIHGEVSNILKRAEEKLHLFINPLLNSNYLASAPKF